MHDLCFAANIPLSETHIHTTAENPTKDKDHNMLSYDTQWSIND